MPPFFLIFRDILLLRRGPQELPHSTQLLAAIAAGCVVVDGLEALVRQGAKSFELWTGQAAPIDVMRDAVRAGP